MKRHQNRILEDIAQSMTMQLDALKRATPLNTFLEGISSILQETYDVDSEAANTAVKASVRSLLAEGLVDPIATLAPAAEQHAWIESANIHGIMGRAITCVESLSAE